MVQQTAVGYAASQLQPVTLKLHRRAFCKVLHTARKQLHMTTIVASCAYRLPPTKMDAGVFHRLQGWARYAVLDHPTIPMAAAGPAVLLLQPPFDIGAVDSSTGVTSAQQRRWYAVNTQPFCVICCWQQLHRPYTIVPPPDDQACYYPCQHHCTSITTQNTSRRNVSPVFDEVQLSHR
jgi:hypothetical protein